MKFDDYQELTKTTAKYPEVGTGSIIAVNYTALGASNEAGELAGKVKKAWRDDDSTITEAKKKELIAEAGDVLWYLSQLANEIGYSLSDIASMNIHKLLDRRKRGVIGGSGDNR
jgi:NTP pyrophosphatase (non-canonical NTP hydrolase)